MRNTMLFIPVVLLLSACSLITERSDNTQPSSSTSETIASTEKSSTKTASSTEQTRTTSNNEEKPALNQLKEQQPNVPMPLDVPISSGYLNVAAAQTKQGYSILYYGSDRPLRLNADELNQEKPIATYLYQYGFASSQETIQVLQPFEIDTNGQQMDLGHQITGYQQGAAGSSYLEWQEGNWRIRIRGNNIDGQEPLPLAKEIVAYLEENRLPVPEQFGKITIDMGDTTNRAVEVSWQEPKNVYTITRQDPIAALKMAVSMKKP
ncbi:hypothetical protein PNC41_09790 [Enterococcus faecium]|uniref:hypothetical protein n=1 Tax=Enterococcus TaxID=1350 RepID=UPI00102EF2BF|nr:MULTISPECIES: hypothetical protein [Enterococcus]MDB7512735.1 hypothetical protein [Enterococcus faecium]MDB7515565.1 hypothetical protein [Enterococcus faecium]MDV4706020.1 hypothetical protein [Enterococcus faecium]MEB4605253.1 hypothetical protein [Enterococcus sp. E4-185]TAQ19473.1 hypothetical protein EWU52_01795 [Enterococcus faecium]